MSFTYRGVRCREKLKLPPTPPNIAYARKFRARIQHEIAVGTFDYAEHFPDSPRARLLTTNPESIVTVREVLRAWLVHVESTLEPETFSDYSEYVENVWLKKFRGERLVNLTREKVDAWIADQTTSRKRILNVLTPLRQAVRWAVATKRLPVDPLGQLKVRRPLTVSDDIVDPFTPAELAAVVAQLPPSAGNLAEFWAWAGPREGELFALTWADVDLTAGTVRIAKSSRAGRTKAPKTRQGTRTIRLLTPALEALRRQQAHTRLMGREVFLNPTTRPQAGGRWRSPVPGRWTEKKLREAWSAACAAAGVRYRPPRQLRHTFASWTLSAGEPLMWVSKVMGHSDPAMTSRVYARFVPDTFPDAGRRTMDAVKGPTA